MGLWEVIKGEQPGFIKKLLNFKNTGQFGEYLTEYALTNHNLRGNLIVMKNIYVPTKGKTVEVDLLMLHEKGIFVFESKNYSGWIFGDAEQLNWTQTLQNGVKNHFYNPIRQNRTHISALADYLDLPVSAFTSCIVFSERCCLKKVPPNNKEIIIVRRPDMLGELRKRLKNSPALYSYDDLQRMSASLARLANKSNEEKQQHIEDIRTKCPYCGSELVLRNGKYGPFWGCSTFPKCRYTRQSADL